MSHIDEGELTAYADGAFAPESAEAKHIAAHLSECANCRNLLAQAEATNVRARGILAIATPETIVVPALPKRRSMMVPMAWAASVVLALGIGYWSRDALLMQEADAPTTPSTAVVTPTSQSEPEAKNQDPPQVVAQAKPARTRRDAPATAPAPVASAPAAELSAPPPALQAPQVAAAAAGAVSEVNVIDPHAIPGIEIVSVKSIANGSIIEQRLPDGKLVTVNATLTNDARNFAMHDQAAGSAAKRMELKLPEAMAVRGRYTIRVMGALPIDSLNALARKIK